MYKKILIGLFCISCVKSFTFFPQEYSVEGAMNLQYEQDEEILQLKNEPFIAVSLGYNCVPALHLRDYGLRLRSFPFDWNITPFDAMYAILEHDFEGFLDLQNLAINKEENTVYNKRYQFKLNHDFEIADWAESSDGLVPVAPESLKKYQKVLAYYARRIARFYDIFELGIPIYLFRRMISSKQALQLNSLLKHKFPNAQFTLVCIQDEQFDDAQTWRDMPENIIYYRFFIPISFSHTKKHEGMAQLFRDLGLIK